MQGEQKMKRKKERKKVSETTRKKMLMLFFCTTVLLIPHDALGDIHPTMTVNVDVAVYGGTPAGVSAAITAATVPFPADDPAASKTSVTLVVPGLRVGGMMSGGLGFDDVRGWNPEYTWLPSKMQTSDGLQDTSARPKSIYGNASTYTMFANAIQAHYATISNESDTLSVEGTHHEPHVAELVFRRMLAAANVSVMFIRGTVQNVSFSDSQHIKSIFVQQRNDTGITELLAGGFIDASYEGDLLDRASCPNRVGRESRSEFGEQNAGVVFTDNEKKNFLRGTTGVASPKVPAMTWRLCFTSNVSNMINVTQPPTTYNRSLYLGYVDDVRAGRMSSVWDAWSGLRKLPPHGVKYDINCNPRPLGFIWAGDRKERYIVANDTERTQLLHEFRDLALGLLYFQQHDVAVPEAERNSNLQYGLCADEFQDNNYFPTQLYIREARRLSSVRMFSEVDMVPPIPDGRPPLRPDACAVGSYPIDSFPCSEERPGTAQQSRSTALEGYICTEQDMISPNTLPLGFMVPPTIENMLVSTAVGATHVAFSSVRLEPTWMMLGGAAGTVLRIAAQTNKLHAVGNVSLLGVQQAVARMQPLVLYTDLPVTSPYYTAMQVLGPHGIADDESFLAHPSDQLPRARATRWLQGCMLAVNSTVRKLAEVPSDNRVDVKRWLDYGPEDPFFDSAVFCARAGVFPMPDPTVLFHPHDDIVDQVWRDWIARALSPRIEQATQTVPFTRGAAALVMLHAINAL
eukprot:m.485224 g.485224  ORF g.485224 m.485224 type:complete len:743 (+) comp21732_c0_seq12:2382-4610(+)